MPRAPNSVLMLTVRSNDDSSLQFLMQEGCHCRADTIYVRTQRKFIETGKFTLTVFRNQYFLSPSA
jgi:hypothetical protein